VLLPFIFTKSIRTRTNNMKKSKTTKKQIIVVPTTTKTIKKKTKSTKVLVKSRLPRSKADTIGYYHCLIDQVANPLNDKKKITQMASHCRCKKGEVASHQQKHKQQLLKQVAQSYLTFGESLGHLIHADVVGCAKQLKK
jgi:translation initiation factor IF-2